MAPGCLGFVGLWWWGRGRLFGLALVLALGFELEDQKKVLVLWFFRHPEHWRSATGYDRCPK